LVHHRMNRVRKIVDLSDWFPAGFMLY
jgi:hypothetical protein